MEQELLLDNIPVSRVLDFPVNSCKKSWYSLVSEICSLWHEYMFMVAKKDMSSSKRPRFLPPLSASNSPNLSLVQWGNTMVLGLKFCKATRSATSPRVSDRNSWNADLHLPVCKEIKTIFDIFLTHFYRWLFLNFWSYKWILFLWWVVA